MIEHGVSIVEAFVVGGVVGFFLGMFSIMLIAYIITMVRKDK